MEGKRILYLECSSGISGDMTVAALLDLGAEEAVLDAALKSIPITGFKTKISRVKKAGLDVCDFDVILDKEYENHDYDMEYLYGDGHTHGHGHDHEHQHIHADHDHEHQHIHADHDHQHIHEHHEHGEENHHHTHRGLPEILSIIEHTEMSGNARTLAKNIFEVLADAESKAHGLPKEQVHFHEVGAVDSIVDIISVAVCMDNLGITDCIVPALSEGTGMIRCQHGVMPVPVPAVANIVQEYGIRLSVTDIKGELVTPTGAAIVAAVRTSERLPESFVIKKTGMGAGKRQYERPSILRAMLIGEEAEHSGRKDKEDVIYRLESNIDDSTGEALGYVMDRLMEAGARDVFFIPVFMKKNRPGCLLNVICDEEKREALEAVIFRETTTIGIRRQRMERSILPRRTEKLRTPLGEARVKVCEMDGMVRKYPEYESVVELCKLTGEPFQKVFRIVESKCNEF